MPVKHPGGRPPRMEPNLVWMVTADNVSPRQHYGRYRRTRGRAYGWSRCGYIEGFEVRLLEPDETCPSMRCKQCTRRGIPDELKPSVEVSGRPRKL